MGFVTGEQSWPTNSAGEPVVVDHLASFLQHAIWVTQHRCRHGYRRIVEGGPQRCIPPGGHNQIRIHQTQQLGPGQCDPGITASTETEVGGRCDQGDAAGVLAQQMSAGAGQIIGWIVDHDHLEGNLGVLDESGESLEHDLAGAVGDNDHRHLRVGHRGDDHGIGAGGLGAFEHLRWRWYRSGPR